MIESSIQTEGAAEQTAKARTPEPPKPATPKRLYTEAEAAIYLGRTLWGMRELRYGGKIDFIPSGRHKYFDVQDLDAWIEKNKTRNNL